MSPRVQNAGLLVGLVLLVPVPRSPAQVALPEAKPVPRMQVIPLPYDRASIQRDGIELTRYHFGLALRRPFLFPIMGPAGRSLTRMGHPHDPVSHSHHNSVWVAHHDVNGDSFWNDQGAGRIIHRRIIRYEDGDDGASILALNAWVGKEGRVHMLERRGMTVQPMDGGEWFLTLDLQFEAEKEPVTLGATPFGMVGVRMAKTIGVNDGGGLIRNSEGNVNEQGPNGAFRKRARWVDYSGPISNRAAEGITLMDHPSNPQHPTPFHVRDDGWMGASLTLEEPITIPPGRPLRLRYGLYVHGGVPEPRVIDAQWGRFSRTAVKDLPAK
ncbi:MAG: PmoA family protein [Isosphaeraceae bacterium]|nr:PmoA family protein [Isosphaeraceae bacterium]